MKKPFLYYTVLQKPNRNSASGVTYDVSVRCANMGFGHSNDPTLVRICDVATVEDGLAEAEDLLPKGVEILTFEAYMTRMADQAEERAAA